MARSSQRLAAVRNFSPTFVRNGSKPVFPFHRTLSAFSSCGHEAAPALGSYCQEGTYAVQQKGLLDNLVGGVLQCERNRQAQRPGGVQVDDELILRRLLDRQITRLRTA